MKNSVAIIEIDSEIVKVIYAQFSAKGFSINKIASTPVSNLSVKAIASSIVKLMNRNAIKPERIIGVMSRRDLTIRTLKLPSANRDELKQMVSYEAVKQIPFPAEEIFYDSRTMATTEDGYSDVVLAIAHKNIVNKIIEILSRSNLKPDILTVTTEGLYLWARVSLAQQINANSSILLMDIDRNKIEVEIITADRILLSRATSFGAASLIGSTAENLSHRERLFLEVKRSVARHKKEQKLPIEKIILTGASNIAMSLSNMFAERLGIETSVVESLSAFNVSNAAFSDNPMPEGSSIASTAGAIFALDQGSLNILPPELKAKHEMAQKGKSFLILFVLGLCAIGIISATFGYEFYQRNTVLRKLKTSIEKMSPVTKKLELKYDKLLLMQEHIRVSNRPTAFLYELHRVVPKNVLLNYLSLGKSGKVMLQGTTPVMAEVFRFVGKLEKSEKFEDVETNYVSKRSFKNKETVDFQITCKLSQ